MLGWVEVQQIDVAVLELVFAAISIARSVFLGNAGARNLTGFLQPSVFCSTQWSGVSTWKGLSSRNEGKVIKKFAKFKSLSVDGRLKRQRNVTLGKKWGIMFVRPAMGQDDDPEH
jgi:hypothetical protein